MRKISKDEALTSLKDFVRRHMDLAKDVLGPKMDQDVPWPKKVIYLCRWEEEYRGQSSGELMWSTDFVALSVHGLFKGTFHGGWSYFKEQLRERSHLDENYLEYVARKCVDVGMEELPGNVLLSELRRLNGTAAEKFDPDVRLDVHEENETGECEVMGSSNFAPGVFLLAVKNHENMPLSVWFMGETPPPDGEMVTPKVCRYKHDYRHYAELLVLFEN